MNCNPMKSRTRTADPRVGPRCSVFVAVAVSSLLPAVALAQPAVEIVYPQPGDCVPNTDGEFLGGIVGGEAGQDPSSVPLILRLSEAQGRRLVVTFSVDGEFLYDADYLPPEGGAPEETDRFQLPAFAVQDGAARTITVHAQVPDGPEVTAEVTVRIDRAPPVLVVDLEALGDIGECVAAVPNPAATAEDAQDPNPTLVSRIDDNGCIQSRVWRMEDSCGNVSEYSLPVIRAPGPNDISLTVTGYLCGLEDCLIGPDTPTFADGARIGRGAVDFRVDGPPGCVGSVDAVIRRDGGAPEILIPGSVIDTPGEYQVDVAAGACDVQAVEQSITFTVVDRPVANAGGPYQAVQGAPLTLSAEASFAAPEFGGITEYAWDLNEDGFYDLVIRRVGEGWINAETNEAVANPARVPFDTAQGDGTYRVWLRVTAGNGGVEFTSATITVTDVSPTCDAGGPYEGVEGDPVVFDGTGSAPGHPSDPIIAYRWDFGDNRPPQAGNGLDAPAHIYGSAGTFTVTLTVIDPDSSTSCEATVEIDGVRPVIAGIGAIAANNLVEGTPVHFTSGQTAPGSPFKPITSYEWDFGDGNFASGPAERSPIHTYMQDGEFEVCLTVRDQDSATSACFDIVVRDVDPIVEFTGPRIIEEGFTATFTARDTRAGSPSDPLTLLVWDFGDGTDPVETPPEQRTIEHVFPRQGEFTVTLTAFDDDSSSAGTWEVVVLDVVPVARARIIYPDEEQIGREGVPVTIDASASEPGSPTDPIVIYRFDFGDGSPPIEGPESIVQHAFPDQGTYQVRVTVVDSDGRSPENCPQDQGQDVTRCGVSVTLVVRVVNVAPEVEIVLEEAEVEIGVATTVTAIVTDVPADLPPAKVEWDMGDGTIINTGDTVVQHTYQSVGQYTIRVLVDDFDGECQPGRQIIGEECSGGGAPICTCRDLNAVQCDSTPDCALIGSSAVATAIVVVNPAAPRIAQIGAQVVTEGATLQIEVPIAAAPREPGPGGQVRFDGPLVVGVPVSPPGSRIEYLANPEDPAQGTTVRITWSPTYYDAGNYMVRITAVGPFTGISRTRDIPIQVREGGHPMLAATGGSPSRGLLTLYEFGREGDRTTFTPVSQIDIGAGASGLAIANGGRWVLVAVPGAGTVAVVSTIGARQLLRSIPTGPGTRSVAVLGRRAYAISPLDGAMSIIDLDTLKVVRRVQLGLEHPTDIVALPAGFDELQADRLAITFGRTGRVGLYDPAAAERGEASQVSVARLGGVLTRVVADPDSGWLSVVDAKTRLLYQFSASDLATNAAGLAPRVTQTGFEATDASASDGRVLAATTAGLVIVEADGTRTVNATLIATALGMVPDTILAGGALAAAVQTGIENYDDELQRILGAPGTRAQRVAAFVALE